MNFVVPVEKQTSTSMSIRIKLPDKKNHTHLEAHWNWTQPCQCTNSADFRKESNQESYPFLRGENTFDRVTIQPLKIYHLEPQTPTPLKKPCCRKRRKKSQHSVDRKGQIQKHSSQRVFKISAAAFRTY